MLVRPPPRPADRRDRRRQKGLGNTESLGPERRRQQHAAAQRRYRKREKNGVLQVKIPVSVEQVAKLHRLHYLRDHELEDRARIAEAISAVLDQIVVD